MPLVDPVHTPPGPRAADWQRVQRLLAVRVDNLGDVLMTTPALAAARASLPGVHVTLLGGPGAPALLPHLPLVDDVIAARVPWVRHEDGVPPAEDAALIARLQAGRFDAAVVFTVCTQSALPAAMVCRLAGIPLRLAHVRENPYDLLTDWVPETDLDVGFARHEVRRQLDLVARVGWRTGDEHLHFKLHAGDVARVDALLHAEGPSTPGDGPWVAVHVGASAPSRRWPPERFGRVAEALARRRGARIVFTGSASEAPLIDAARAAMSAPSLAWSGRLSLGELGALVARCSLVVTNNSGPAHLAAALGTPLVALYALTNPQHTPWQAPSHTLSHDVPCRNCLQSRCPQAGHPCLTGVSVDSAVEAALSLLPAAEALAA